MGLLSKPRNFERLNFCLKYDEFVDPINKFTLPDLISTETRYYSSTFQQCNFPHAPHCPSDHSTIDSELITILDFFKSTTTTYNGHISEAEDDSWNEKKP